MIHPGERYRDKFGAVFTIKEIDEINEVITARRYSQNQQLSFEWWRVNVVERVS